VNQRNDVLGEDPHLPQEETAKFFWVLILGHVQICLQSILLTLFARDSALHFLATITVAACSSVSSDM